MPSDTTWNLVDASGWDTAPTIVSTKSRYPTKIELLAVVEKTLNHNIADYKEYHIYHDETYANLHLKHLGYEKYIFTLKKGS